MWGFPGRQTGCTWSVIVASGVTREGRARPVRGAGREWAGLT